MPAKDAERAIDPRNAWIMTSLLKDVVRVGTATRALSLNRTDLAGKTGTTNENVDAWFCGYNAAMVAVAWIGFDQPRTLGANETGRHGGASDLDLLHGEGAQGDEGSGAPDARRRRRGEDQSPTPGCATTAGAITEYFFSEFPPRGRDDSFSAGSGAGGEGHSRPAVLAGDRMGRRPDGSETGHDRGRGSDGRARRDRERIAQTAARLIAEHGLTDWALAKRKAARQLMLPESAALPSNDEIEAALASITRCSPRTRTRRACARSDARRSPG